MSGSYDSVTLDQMSGGNYFQKGDDKVTLISKITGFLQFLTVDTLRMLVNSIGRLVDSLNPTHEKSDGGSRSRRSRRGRKHSKSRRNI